MVFKFERFPNLSDRSFGLGSPIGLGYLPISFREHQGNEVSKDVKGGRVNNRIRLYASLNISLVLSFL